jgi:hypothetical protein
MKLQSKIDIKNHELNDEIEENSFQKPFEKPQIRLGKNKWLYTADDFGKMEKGRALYQSKINYIRGSIFQPERFKLEAITVFIPIGLSAIRIDCRDFVRQFKNPLEKCEEFFLFKNNYKNDTLNSLRYVLVDRNKSHKIYDSWDISEMVAYTLGRFSKLGVKRIGMNGIRISSGIPELQLVHEVKLWLAFNEHEFEEIYFIDLRDGFNKNA